MNLKKRKHKKKPNKAHHIQTAQNQQYGESHKSSQGEKRYLQYRETKKTAISPQKQCKQDDKGAIYKLLKE